MGTWAGCSNLLGNIPIRVSMNGDFQLGCASTDWFALLGCLFGKYGGWEADSIYRQTTCYCTWSSGIPLTMGIDQTQVGSSTNAGGWVLHMFHKKIREACFFLSMNTQN